MSDIGSSGSIKLLSDITVFNKYAKYIPELGRRETWEELITRNMDMHIKKYPMLEEEIRTVYRDFVLTKKVLPSMRGLQFSGKPIDLSPNRIFNCAYTAIDDYRVFSEIMFLLLGGSGVGYSVQRHHVAKLPPIKRPIRSRRFVIGDSIEGWADAVKALVSAYFIGKAMPRFDFSDIRPKGAALITSGGKAPGPEPLKDCLHNLQKIFDRKKDGEQLSTLEVHDIVTHIADAVLAGGIRRAALIALFNIDDDEMLYCKSGNWYELNPQRARANNSAMVLRHKVTKEDFFGLWEKIKASGSGEPGFLLSNNQEIATNPCFSGDTKVAIADGVNNTLTIKEMAESGKDYPVYCLDNDGKAVIRTFRDIRITGKDKQLYKITFDNGDVVRATGNHKFRLYNGEWKSVEELQNGDSIWSMTKYHGKFFNKTSRSQDYAWINNKGTNVAEHRLIAEFGNNTKIQPGYVVHHKDRNGLNNHIDNLEIMTNEAHVEHHSKNMIGNGNPMVRAKVEWSEEKWEDYRSKQRKNSIGENNKNFSGISHEELFDHAIKLTKQLGRRFSNDEYGDYAKENNLPQNFSMYRKKEFGSIKNMAKLACEFCGFELFENLDLRTVRNYLSLQEKGIECSIINGRVSTPKKEKVKKIFTQEEKDKLRAKMAKYHEEKKEIIRLKQAEIWSKIRFTLGHTPQKIEWVQACKDANISFEIARVSSPFRTYEDLKEFASMYNHKVVSVEKDLVEDVYCGSVDDFHNFFVGNISEFTKNGKLKLSFVNVKNCSEISLRSCQFCNLTEINLSTITSQEDLNARTKAASFISTLQAGYTDFHYLRDIWKRTTEKEALIGVSGTGIASGAYKTCNLTEAANVVKEENKRIAKIIGINTAARQTCVKPSGCLVPETKVKTNLGDLSLTEIFKLNGYDLDNYINTEREFLNVTKEILVKDENDSWQPITKLYVNGHEPCYDILFADGLRVKATKEHKFKTKNRGWVRADNLNEKDIIVSYDSDGDRTYTNIKQLETRLVKRFTVDIEIDSTHTYQLSNGTVTHNTTSLVLGTSSGIHAWFDKYYIRRMKLGKNEAIYKYLLAKVPELIEDDFFKPNLDAFIKIPIAAPEGAVIAPTESPIELLERIKHFSKEWIKPGHIKGDNSHNVSATVYIKPDEWDLVGNWMWDNRDCYNGLSVLPFNGGTYKQAPHESITKEQYEEMVKYLKDIDLSEVLEYNDNTSVSGELACAGGACEVQY